MTPLPKKKHTRSRSNKRRSKIKLILPDLSVCPSCKKPRLPHKACPACGFYEKTAAKAV